MQGSRQLAQARRVLPLVARAVGHPQHHTPVRVPPYPSQRAFEQDRGTVEVGGVAEIGRRWPTAVVGEKRSALAERGDEWEPQDW